MQPRFLLADHQALDRALLRARLLDLFEAEAVDEAMSLDAAIALAGRRYDLVLVDPELPGMNFADGLRRLRDAVAPTEVVLVVRRMRPTQVRAASRLGVRGFLPKTLSPRSFAAAIRLLLAGGSYVPLAIEDVDTTPGSRTSWRELLTDAERLLLTLVGRGLSNREIAQLLGRDEATLHNDLARLFRKVGARTRSDLAAQAALAGFV